jgi:cell division septal protein FtsQ
MASHLNPPLKYRAKTAILKSMQFQRGSAKIKTKKVQRKITLKFKHILIAFLLLCILFYGLQQIYLFLISWDNLNVKHINISCQRDDVKKEISRLLEGKNLGNMLLLNIDHIRNAVNKLTWVKQVRVRKIFPSSLKIETQMRTPVALLKKDNIYLIDKEGTLLKKIGSKEKFNLPLLIDSNSFRAHYQEKLELAWGALESLSLSEKSQIEVMDLTDYDNVTVRLKGNLTWLILGNELFSQKIKAFQDFNSKSEKWGPLEYVDLRFFQDRLYIKPQKKMSRSLMANSIKEAN